MNKIWFDSPPPKSASGGYFCLDGFPKEIIVELKEKGFEISPLGCHAYEECDSETARGE